MAKVKFKQEKVDKKGRFTDWIRPVMNGYHMSCCECGLVHTINFRSIEIFKIYKNGTKEGYVLPKKKYQVEMKVRRNEKLTKQLRKK